MGKNPNDSTRNIVWLQPAQQHGNRSQLNKSLTQLSWIQHLVHLVILQLVFNPLLSVSIIFPCYFYIFCNTINFGHCSFNVMHNFSFGTEATVWCPGMSLSHQPLWHGITLTRPLRHFESYVGTRPVFTSPYWSLQLSAASLRLLSRPHSLYSAGSVIHRSVYLSPVFLCSYKNHLLCNKRELKREMHPMQRNDKRLAIRLD